MLLFSLRKDIILWLTIYSTTVIAALAVGARAFPISTIRPEHIHGDRVPSLPQLFTHPLIGAYAFTSPEWVLDFHAFHTLLPDLTAASTLLSFYEDVAAKAATTTTSIADRSLFRAGEITLEVRSALGAVPWVEVIAFANWMRENTKRGFTGTYQINFVHRRSGKLLTMSLWVGILRWG